jgi:hypothetical protein
MSKRKKWKRLSTRDEARVASFAENVPTRSSQNGTIISVRIISKLRGNTMPVIGQGCQQHAKRASDASGTKPAVVAPPYF